MIFESMIKDRRGEILGYLKANRFERVIDFGGAMDPWAAEFVTHYVDLQDPEKYHPGIIGDARVIQGDLDDPQLWINLGNLQRFDFAICTQTLEHVLNPGLVLKNMAFIANEGFIGIPSKHVELYKKAHINKQEDLDAHSLSGYFRGFVPHRWVVTIRDDVVWFWPKLGFLEFLKLDWADSDELKVSEELCFRWEGIIPHRVVNDIDLDFSTPYEAIEFYRTGLQKGL